MPVHFEKKKLSYSLVFQTAMKAGADATSLNKFLRTRYGYIPTMPETYFSVEGAAGCLFFYQSMLLTKTRLVGIQGGMFFDSYIRSDSPAEKSLDPTVKLYGRRLSQLPFQNDGFAVLCSNLLSYSASGPEANAKCGPVFQPYVASKYDADPLGRVIGKHEFTKHGARGGRDYDDPVDHGLHPVYMLLPPLKSVLIVAVQDIEKGEQFDRDGINPVYLSIKDGKVVDQLNEYCNLQLDYSCQDGSGKIIYQLLESGKFSKRSK